MRSACAAVVLGAGLGLALGSTDARAAEQGGEEPQAWESAVQEPTGEEFLAQRLFEYREERQRRREVWWSHTREVLFTDIELSPEQTREVDNLIEAQLSKQARLQQLETELAVAQRQEDMERSRALRAQRQGLKAQLKERHEIMEEMRAVLAEEQRPAFDMNRARLVSERKQPRKARKGSP